MGDEAREKEGKNLIRDMKNKRKNLSLIKACVLQKNTDEL
jgi:hypothetical protein